MTTEPTTVEKLRGLPWSIASNATNTVFVQFTYFGSVFILFLSALGLSKTEMGFLLSLMPFFGLIALFVTPAVARFGYKRTYVTFFGLRAFVTAFLLFTPAVMAQFGSQVTLWFVGAVVAIFAVLRAVGVTASFPWIQQYVPNNVRGKYTATSNMFTTLTGFAAVTVASYALGVTVGLTGFMWLIAVGVVFGFISVALSYFIPGGAPMAGDETKERQGRDLHTAARDPDFLRYLAGVGLITLATVPLGSFLPLFMRDEVGLNDSQVVWLQTGALVGSLASSYLWGWAADRFGSIPVTLYGILLRMSLPILWMFMPRQSPWSLYAALLIAIMQGVADMGWGIGSARLLYVRIVPSDKRTDYMAFYYAWIGIVGGFSQLYGGRVLDMSRGLSGSAFSIVLDPYTPLFLTGLILPAVAFFVLRGIGDANTMGMGEFAGIFLRGNPFLAMSSMIRYHLARDEHETVLITERLGQAKSPLTVDELLEALADPRFNVRFEAVVSIARMRPNPRLIDALVKLLDGRELALTAVAAWALGRMGDSRAVEPLRRSLDSSYRSIRAHSARALGALGDVGIAPALHERLQQEQDLGLQMAYASALGNLRHEAATPILLELLRTSESEGAAMELALTLARIVGDEHYFIQLHRRVRADMNTALAQSITAIRRKTDRSPDVAHICANVMDQCADRMARGDLEQGSVFLSQALHQLPSGHVSEAGAMILEECANQLQNHGAQRVEYAMLALHTLQVDWRA